MVAVAEAGVALVDGEGAVGFFNLGHAAADERGGGRAFVHSSLSTFAAAAKRGRGKSPLPRQSPQQHPA